MNESSKETKSTQPSESIPETTVRSSAQQKFPWHVECEVETTEKGTIEVRGHVLNLQHWTDLC